MAIVETLEVRFQANLSGIKSQINSLIAALSKLGSASSAADAKLNKTLAIYSKATNLRASTLQRELSAETKYQSALKNTSRIAKSAGKAIRKTADGIGLHRLDEINLTDAESKSGSGGGSGSGSGGSSGGFATDEDKLRAFLKALKTAFSATKELNAKLKGAFSGIADGLDRLSGGVLGKIAENLFGENFAETVKERLVSALGSGIETAAQETPTTAASTLVSRLAEGISSGRGKIAQAAKSVSAAADFASSNAKTEAYNAGANLSTGFANGISSKLESVRSSVSKLVGAAVAKIREKLDIHSPSKVTFGIGEYFGEGFANGISASVQSAARSAASLSDRAASALNVHTEAFAQQDNGVSLMVRSAVNDALGNTNLVIPLNVDGVKLGEASIRGINRAMRSAGKVLLEI